MNDYLKMIERLLAENKTTGENHSEGMIHYTKLNLQRMNRWMKKGEVLPEVKALIESIDEKQNWVLLTEAWCGDAAHSTPFISMMAELNPKIDLEIKLRDKNLELMDQYLTNGGRSIPKLIAFDEDGREIFNWGPRPNRLQDTFLQNKSDGMPMDDNKLELQRMYNADKGKSLQREIARLLQQKITELA